MTLIEQFSKLIPNLLPTMHKGQAGRIAILGGSKEYTGAPYFAGMSSLRIGSDICHIFAPEEGGTATAIKSMSPDLIVHSITKDDPSLIIRWLLSVHVLIIGPGLGRDKTVWNQTSEVIKAARNINLPMVLDGDALRLVAENLDIIKGYEAAILTPNVMEYKGLSDSVKLMSKDTSNSILSPDQMSLLLGNVTIVQKGREDIITNGAVSATCDVDGIPRRCGGQGDILAGAIGTMYAWALLHMKNKESPLHNTSLSPNQTSNDTPTTPISVLSAHAACTLLRRSSQLAFAKHRRSTISADIINELPTAFEDLFPELTPKY
eukprot:gene7702-9019_t